MSRLSNLACRTQVRASIRDGRFVYEIKVPNGYQETNLIATTKITEVSLFMLFVMTEKNSALFLCLMVVTTHSVNLYSVLKRNTPELSEALL